jgi:hypothetical protein
MSVRDWTTGILGVAVAIGVGVAGASPGISVGELSAKMLPRSGKLQEEMPNISKPMISKPGMILRMVLFLV